MFFFFFFFFFFCCLLFNYQGSLSLLFETAYLDYHIRRHLSRTFLIFFRPAFQLSVCHLFLKHSFVSSDSLLRISQAVVFVNCYFILFFRNNSRRFLIMIRHFLLFRNQFPPSSARLCYLTALSNATARLIYHKGV